MKECGKHGCTDEATVVMVMRAWDPRIPAERRSDINQMTDFAVGLQACDKHAEECRAMYEKTLDTPDIMDKVKAAHGDSGMAIPTRESVAILTMTWAEVDALFRDPRTPVH